jgi:hypothetical protein
LTHAARLIVADLDDAGRDGNICSSCRSRAIRTPGSDRRSCEATCRAFDQRRLSCPRINLADALGIVLLMGDHDDPVYERAAFRWVARLASERPNIGLQELAATVRALQALAGTRPARAALAELCARHQVGAVVGLSAPRSPAEPNGAHRVRARP